MRITLDSSEVEIAIEQYIIAKFKKNMHIWEDDIDYKFTVVDKDSDKILYGALLSIEFEILEDSDKDD